MTRYPSGMVGSIIFMRGDDIVGRYKVTEKAMLIVSASSVLYENTEALGGLTEYIEAKRANIHVYANGEVELLLTDREYLPHKSTDHAIELVTDVSKRLEVSKDTRVYIFGRKVVLSIYPTENGYMIYSHRSKDAYEFLKPVIEKIRKEHAIVI